MNRIFRDTISKCIKLKLSPPTSGSQILRRNGAKSAPSQECCLALRKMQLLRSGLKRESSRSGLLNSRTVCHRRCYFIVIVAVNHNHDVLFEVHNSPCYSVNRMLSYPVFHCNRRTLRASVWARPPAMLIWTSGTCYEITSMRSIRWGILSYLDSEKWSIRYIYRWRFIIIADISILDECGEFCQGLQSAQQNSWQSCEHRITQTMAHWKTENDVLKCCLISEIWYLKCFSCRYSVR